MRAYVLLGEQAGKIEKRSSWTENEGEQSHTWRRIFRSLHGNVLDLWVSSSLLPRIPAFEKIIRATEALLKYCEWNFLTCIASFCVFLFIFRYGKTLEIFDISVVQ